MAADLSFPDISAPAVPAVQAAGAVAVPTITVKDAVLALFKPMEPQLRALAERYRDVAFDVSTPKGLKAAKDARAELRKDGRFAIQNLRDEAKDKLNEAKKVAEAEAERLIGIVQPREDEIDAIIKDREAEIAAEQQREEDRKSRHREAIAKIQSWATRARAANPSAQKLAEAIGTVDTFDVSAEAFEEFAAQAEEAKAQTLQVLREMHAAAFVAEERAVQQRRDAAVANIGRIVMSCTGKSPQEIESILLMLKSTVYSEEMGDEVLKVHEQALVNVQLLLDMAIERAELLALARDRAEREAERARDEALAFTAAREQAQAQTITQDAQESGSLPAAAGAYASSEAEAAEASPSGDSGEMAHAEERAIAPSLVTPDDFVRWVMDTATADAPLETSEADAIEPPAGYYTGPITLEGEEPASLDLQTVLGEALELVKHLQAAREGRFPSHPKPEKAWWDEAFAKADALVPMLEQAVAEVCA